MGSMTQHLSQLSYGIPDGGGDGFLRRVPIPLGALDLESSVALAADETNAKVIKVEEDIDSFFTEPWLVPGDYDPSLDQIKLRVLASMLTVSTDDDVELDLKAYKKVAGSALGSDLDPDAPGTVLSTTEQWLEFDLSSNALEAGNILHLNLISNGKNDTNGEEILIHAIEVEYASTLVLADMDSR